jgi:hypothetical protein
MGEQVSSQNHQAARTLGVAVLPGGSGWRAGKRVR